MAFLLACERSVLPMVFEGLFTHFLTNCVFMFVNNIVSINKQLRSLDEQ